MSFIVVLVHFVLAVILFYLVNWIGAKSKPLEFGYVQMSVGIQDDTAPLFNYFFKVLAPVVYLILLAALFQAIGLNELNNKIYWIVIDYWAFRLLYITVKGQIRLTNWPLQIIYWISSIGLAIWVYSILDSIGTVLPDPKNLLEELWILIIIFLYSIFNKLEYSRTGAQRRIKNYTANKYHEFKSRFGSIVDSSFDMNEFRVLVYSVMIYEDFNRPRLARWLERLVFRKCRKPHTFGVMQVMSSNPLTDEESVVKGIEKIKSLLESGMERWRSGNEKVYIQYLCRTTIGQYNPGDQDYSDQVMQVYDNIAAMFYNDIRFDVAADLVWKDLKQNG